MWKDLSSQWQRSFELAYDSYRRGTIPIGAVISDSKGNIVSEGRNRIFDKESTNPLAGTFMAHAEMTAMINLKSNDHPDIRSYTLYTTMEPCPMCFGAMVMMNIRSLKYAARDAFVGATLLNDKMDYIRDKGISIEKGNNEMEAFHLIVQTAYEYDRNHLRVNDLVDAWKKIDINAIELGRKLFNERYFDKAISKDINISDIYDEIVYKYNQII